MVIGIFNGSLMAINMPSRQAIISDIVPDSKLMNAISLNFSSMNLTRIAGPALAGFLGGANLPIIFSLKIMN